jgi:CubicO group peptidase (beta-lactamase class C family)
MMTAMVTAMVTAGLAPGVTAAVAEPQLDDVAAIDAYMRQYQEQTGTPGLAFAVVRGDQVVHSRVWGEDGDGAGITAQTPFLLGSVAKPFTALAVMQLVEAGKVDLDGPVRRYLPWFRLADESASERITVRHLLTHTSGLARWAVPTDRFDNTADGLTRSVRELAAVQPVTAPGETHQYSDANYMVLGVLVETVAGQPFGEYLRRAVLDPLQMRHAAATAAQARAVGLPAGHRYYLGHPRRFYPPYDTSGVPYGYLGASLDDLTHFVTAQLCGGRYANAQILSPQGITQTHTGQVATSTSGRYGLGWRDSTLDGTDTRVVWHAGAAPGYFSHLVLAPDFDLGVIVLANAYSPAIDAQLAVAAFNLIRLNQGQPPKTATADPLFTAALAGLLAMAGLLLTTLTWWTVRAVRQHPAKPTSARRTIANTIGWLISCTALIVGTAWLLPASTGADLAQAMLWTPDIAHAIIAVVVLAATLAMVRLARTVHFIHARKRADNRAPAVPTKAAVTGH